MKKRLTDEKRNFIRENVHRMSIGELAEAIEMSRSTVSRFCSLEKLKETPVPVVEEDMKERTRKRGTPSAETRRKISLALLGRKKSIETRKKMSEAQKRRYQLQTKEEFRGEE